MIVYVEQEIYDRLNERLKDIPEKMPIVMKRTINDTAKSARGKILEELKRKYVMKKGSFNEELSIEYATERHWNATLETKGGPIPLYDFQIRKNRGKTAAKAKVLTTSTLEELKIIGGDRNGKDLKAFVQKMPDTGHYGIFRRLETAEKVGVQAQYSKEKEKFKIAKKRNKSFKEEDNEVLNRLGKRLRRNFIRQLYSLSVPQMVGGERVFPVVKETIDSGMRENLEKHIAQVMEGLK